MLKGTAFSALGSLSPFSLPALARAIQEQQYTLPEAQTQNHRCAHGAGTRAWTADAHKNLHGPGHLRAGRSYGCRSRNVVARSAAGVVCLSGRDPLDVEAIWERIRTLGIFAGAQGGQYITALVGSRNCAVGSCRQGPWIARSTSSWAENFATKFRSIATRTWTFLSDPRRTGNSRGSRLKALRP